LSICVDETYIPQDAEILTIPAKNGLGDLAFAQPTLRWKKSENRQQQEISRRTHPARVFVRLDKPGELVVWQDGASRLKIPHGILLLLPILARGHLVDLLDCSPAT
jgi:hypothetical protein